MDERFPENEMRIMFYTLNKTMERLADAILGMTMKQIGPYLTLKEAAAWTGISEKTLGKYAAKGRLRLCGNTRPRKVERDHLDDQMALGFPELEGRERFPDYIPEPSFRPRCNPAPAMAVPDGLYSRLRNTEELLAACGVKKYQKKLQGEENGKKSGRGRSKKDSPQNGEGQG